MISEKIEKFIERFIDEQTNKYFCKHCGEVIIITKNHYYNGIPKYIYGHTAWSKGLTKGTDERIEKMAERRKGQKRPSIVGDNNPSKRPEVRKKMSNNNWMKTSEGREFFINNNPSKRPEVREKLSGENNPNFKDWSSRKPYCEKWSPELREEIRKRDEYICQYPGCLCSQLEHKILYNNQSLNVHHVHYDKENCYPDLITLCTKHNAVVNFNREYYEKIFMKILEQRNLLNWKIQTW